VPDRRHAEQSRNYLSINDLHGWVRRHLCRWSSFEPDQPCLARGTIVCRARCARARRQL